MSVTELVACCHKMRLLETLKLSAVSLCADATVSLLGATSTSGRVRSPNQVHLHRRFEYELKY